MTNDDFIAQARVLILAWTAWLLVRHVVKSCYAAIRRAATDMRADDMMEEFRKQGKAP